MVRIFTGPVRGPDFSVRIIGTGPDFFVVRSVPFSLQKLRFGPDISARTPCEMRYRLYHTCTNSVKVLGTRRNVPAKSLSKTSVKWS